MLVYLMKKAASMPPVASSTSRRTQQGSGESDLTFNHDPEMDDEDIEMDFE